MACDSLLTQVCCKLSTGLLQIDYHKLLSTDLLQVVSTTFQCPCEASCSKICLRFFQSIVKCSKSHEIADMN